MGADLLKYFNSTLVRLTETLFGEPFSDAQFQFHIGAINSVIVLYINSPYNLFQFHIGAINSTTSALNRMGLNNFNSTLVRLTALSPTSSTCSILFQFHIGAINRGGSEDKAFLESNFNSTLVRLTVHNDSSEPSFGRFQFHIGAINSAVDCTYRVAPELFQFHIGAINSRRL